MIQKINKKIAIRLDDFHENCDLEKWEYLVEELLKRIFKLHLIHIYFQHLEEF